MSNHASHALLRVSALVLCALPMHGETGDTRAIAGSVGDSRTALMVGAGIVVKSEATQKEGDLATDGDGNVSLLFLPTCKYDLTVHATGFESFILNFVVVSASLPFLQTENAALGRDIDQETVVDLLLVDRNFTGILDLTDRINTDIADATQLGSGSQEIRANGARSGDDNFMPNGVDASSYSSNITEVTPLSGAGIVMPVPCTIQEFEVQTSLYDAQYGRGAGANVHVETRSGTADLYGDASFGRNEILQANNFFANATGAPRGEFQRSQPESTLGGATPPSQTQAAKTEGKDLYRHSASVQSLARMMHLQVETTARLFENFNVLVLMLGIGIPLGRFLPKLLRKRSEKIR